MKLDELEVYQTAMRIGEQVWGVVDRWNWFAKDTVGKQWVKSADSMAANLSEGYGRFFYKENRQFGYYARGSLFETITWLEKARTRNLITAEQHAVMRKKLESLAVRLNNYIRSIGKGDGAVHESPAVYDVSLPVEFDLPDTGDLTAPLQ